MPKATHGVPQPSPIPKRTYLVKLPSGRYFDFGCVIDAHWDGDDGEWFAITQAAGGAVRELELTGEDAEAADYILGGIHGIHCPARPKAPGIEIARQMPQVK